MDFNNPAKRKIMKIKKCTCGSVDFCVIENLIHDARIINDKDPNTTGKKRRLEAYGCKESFVAEITCKNCLKSYDPALFDLDFSW